MKYLVLYFSILVISCSSKSGEPGTIPPAKPDTTTIVLMRHAEKESTGSNPVLTARGKNRAEKLSQFLTDIKPDAFYSTNYTRTKQTLEPWANALGKTIQIYEVSKQDSVAGMLKQQTNKTIVVAGHSNTIPRFVNVLTGQANYTDLPDTEYRKIFIVTITDKQTSVEERIFEP
jgi:broad specificity phosphatase PhoE